TVVAMCGPPVMYKFVLLELAGVGIEGDRVFVDLERRMRCGVGKCGHCQINDIYCCQDGPVFRFSEIAHLKVSDIDSARMLIRIEQGKGRKDRYVMLSPDLLALLRQWWRAKRPKGWLFPGQRPGQPITPRQLNRACAKAATSARIGKRVSMHTLRHSFATHLLEQKVDIRVIQTLLGHRKLDTTAIYTRVALKTIRNVESPLTLLAPPPA
ncbi:tyrosine-type recombinase/integrase, partial [bacterium]|nr:tyrosine-type recombinase/integrase [bacterium]